jgi:acyl-CoA dehydrogenase
VTGPSELNTLLERTLDELFTDHCTPRDRRVGEADGWLSRCWEVLAEAGLPWIGVSEASGGSGGDLAQACTLLRAVGRHAVPLPIAECALLGGWLLATAGLPVPRVPLTVAVPATGDQLALDADSRLSGVLERVPWARQSSIVALIGLGSNWSVVLIDATRCTVRSGRNLAGEPRDHVVLDRVPAELMAPVGPDVAAELSLRGALSRSMLLVGAMQTVCSMTCEYANKRHQFGRSIASFQAVASHLVQITAEVEAATMGATVAQRRFGEAGVGAEFEVAAAKSTASRAASDVIAKSHQVHGAMGMTQEYPLHDFTRRLMTWRREWGSESHWATIAGRGLAAGGGPIWPRVATGPRRTAAATRGRTGDAEA